MGQVISFFITRSSTSQVSNQTPYTSRRASRDEGCRLGSLVGARNQGSAQPATIELTITD
jgi:hypothetical protein